MLDIIIFGVIISTIVGLVGLFNPNLARVVLNQIESYALSILLFLLGSLALIKYLLGDSLESQPLAMLFAGLALISVGVFSLPVILDKIGSNFYKTLYVFGIAGSFALGYAVISSVDEEIEFQKTKKSVQAKTVQRLRDIRDTQLAHKSVYGTFAPDFDSLSRFIHSAVIPVTYNMGSFHDTLPEPKSFKEGYIIKRADLDSLALMLELERDLFETNIEEDNSPYKIRDTTLTSFYSENLTKYHREKAKLPLFKLSEMPFNPNTGERFKMKVGVVEVGGLWLPTILVQDPTPFGREKVKKDTLRFGSTTEAHTDGNWRD